MNLNLTGNHLDITPAIRDYVVAKLDRVTRHFDHVIDVNVVMSVDKLRQKVEANLHTRGKDIHVEAIDPDMYAAIDALVDKLDRQVVKHKEKRALHRHERRARSSARRAATKATPPARRGRRSARRTSALIRAGRSRRRAGRPPVRFAAAVTFRLPIGARRSVPSLPMSQIAELLPAANILLDLDAGRRRSLFDAVGALFEAQPRARATLVVDSLHRARKTRLDRAGQGIAIPHGRIKGLADAQGAFVRLRRRSPFDAPDGKPVAQVFVLLVPEHATEQHLQLLSELAQMFSETRFRERLAAAPDADAVHAIFRHGRTHERDGRSQGPQGASARGRCGGGRMTGRQRDDAAGQRREDLRREPGAARPDLGRRPPGRQPRADRRGRAQADDRAGRPHELHPPVPHPDPGRRRARVPARAAGVELAVVGSTGCSRPSSSRSSSRTARTCPHTSPSNVRHAPRRAVHLAAALAAPGRGHPPVSVARARRIDDAARRVPRRARDGRARSPAPRRSARASSRSS